MSGTDVVTFALTSGSKVTAPRHLAERLGWKSEPEPKSETKSEPEPKPRPVKRSPKRS